MRLHLAQRSEFKLASKIIILFSLFFIVFLAVNYWYVKWMSENKIKENLAKTLNHIASDIQYENGKWNAMQYFQDSSTPVDKPLYIITNEGFIIDRMNPITGFLDTAQFDFLHTFTEPQTITSPANTTWRIYSIPIMRNSKVYGTIATSYFEPKEPILSTIDRELAESAQHIDRVIDIRNEKIVADKIHPKLISHAVYFVVVDKFNKVLAEEGGPPSFIDRSFIAQALQKTSPYVIVDEITHAPFLVHTKPLTTPDNHIGGIIVAAEPLGDLYQILNNQRKFSAVSSFSALAVIFLLLIYLSQKELKKIFEEKKKELLKEIQHSHIALKKIYFDKNQGKLYLDTTPYTIEYGSKQHDLCKTLFSLPKKRWEYDELIEKNHMHEELHNDRIFYDAMLSINKKLFNVLGKKLIVYENKTYRINPLLLPLITKASEPK